MAGLGAVSALYGCFMLNSCLRMGDLNTKFGESVRELPSQAELSNADCYIYPDNVQYPNENACLRHNMCSC